MSAAVDLGYVLDRTDPGGELPVEDDSRLASVPDDLPARAAASDISDPMLPLFVRPAEKRALDLISDWPWISLQELAGLMGVAPQRASQLVKPPGGVRPCGPHRPGPLPACPQGPHLRGRRQGSDGASPRRTPWAPSSGATSPGRRTRQLLRNIEHTAAVHGFLAALTAQAPLLGVGGRPTRPAAQGLPSLPARRPDARRQPRRLRRPAQGREPIGPSSWNGSAAPCGPRPCRTASRPICATTHLTGPSDDHGVRPAVLVVFDDEIAQTHFLRVAREEMRAEQVTVPLWVSHREAIDAPGAAGRRMAHARRMGVAKDPAAPCEPGQTGGEPELQPRSRIN